MCSDHTQDRDYSRQELIDALREAHQQVLNLQAQLAEYKWIEDALHRRTRELSERVKELDCLYSISECLRHRDDRLAEVLDRIVNLVPKGYQNPDRTCACVTVSDRTFRSRDFRHTAHSHSAQIHTGRKQVGSIQVYVSPPVGSGDEPLFLAEEDALLNALAVWIGEIVEHRESERDAWSPTRR
jgi:nitrate/nitrite-specific signal transduction histidine kinase